MARKSRLPKARLTFEHPPLVQMLLDGVAIPRTPETREQLVDIAYFSWWTGTPPEASQRAFQLLGEWRDGW